MFFVSCCYKPLHCSSFTNATGDAKELYLEFGHDTSILVAMAAMNLNKYVSVWICRRPLLKAVLFQR